MNGKFEWDVELFGIGLVGGFGVKKDDIFLYYFFIFFIFLGIIYKYDIVFGKFIMYC